MGSIYMRSPAYFLAVFVIALLLQFDWASTFSKKENGHWQWHHGAFQDVKDRVRSDVRRMLHSRAEVPFQVPLEVNVVLVGFGGDGGYRYALEPHKLEDLLTISFPTHRPSCMETGDPLDIEHRLVYNVFPSSQLDLISVERAIRDAMVPSGTAIRADFVRQLPLFEAEATLVEPVFEKLYTRMFANPEKQSGRSFPAALFILNPDKARMDPRNGTDPEKPMHEETAAPDGGYVYRYRYEGGGASQLWLGAGRFAVIDLSAGPCTYGKIEAEEGSVSFRTLPRLHNASLPSGPGANTFLGHLAALVSTTVELIIAPDVRFETVDLTSRLLIPIVVLQNHNRYNVMEKGHNYSIDVDAIRSEVGKMVHEQQEIVVIGGSYSLHRHEKLAIAVSGALRGRSLRETDRDGRFRVRTKTYLDAAVLRDELERSADVLAVGLIEMADPSLSAKFFFRQDWGDDETPGDSVVGRRRNVPDHSLFGSVKKHPKKKGDLLRTFGTRVVPVIVLSLADVDPHLMMEDESLVWTSDDVVIVLQHDGDKIPLSYVSETERRHATPARADRSVLAGLASVVGGLSAPYEKASPVHERRSVNWLWAAGCHPFGPFSDTARVSQLLRDVALRNTVYARVDAALRGIRATSESVQAFAAEYLKTPLGEPVRGKRERTVAELWLEKFYKRTAPEPEPFPHELVERLEKYLDRLEERLVELSALLYDHRLTEARSNSTDILQSSFFTKSYVDRVLDTEREKMRCCTVLYRDPVHHRHAFLYGGILAIGFIVYSLVIYFASPVR